MMLITGDSGTADERWLLARPGPLTRALRQSAKLPEADIVRLSHTTEIASSLRSSQ